MKTRVLVFTPTYNEIGNIEKWLDEVASYSSADISLTSNRPAELEAVRQIIGMRSINDRFAGQN